tara:strand:+ start:64879 stop:65562 length:684 start_codon:yes stop_codon:yes gene_type:complete
MKIAVLLHGNGVYDGTEIQEAVLSLLAIKEAGHEYQCMAPNYDQHHVINHVSGEELKEKRNILIESARIARGDILDLKDVDIQDFDALMMPGGFGTAKNFTTWAFDGPKASINPIIANFLTSFQKAEKPIIALCMSPTTLAKAFENSGINPKLSVGSTAEKSPYEIAAISQGMESLGVNASMTRVNEISIDKANKLICAPCYMMEADIIDVRKNISQAIAALQEFEE